MPMGFSFQPGADVSMQGQNGSMGRMGRSLPEPASAVKVLSFRMPKHAPPSAIAPAALLNAAGGGGLQSGGLTPQLLSMLLSAFSAPQQGGPFGGSAPAPASPSFAPTFGPPRVTPGDEGDRRRYDGPESQGPIAPPTEFFDRSQPQAPLPGGRGFDMPLDYQTYGMVPDLFR